MLNVMLLDKGLPQSSQQCDNPSHLDLNQTKSDQKSTEKSIASSIKNATGKSQESAKASDSVNPKAVNSRNKIREKWEINPSYNKTSENNRQTSKSKNDANESPSTKVNMDSHCSLSSVRI